MTEQTRKQQDGIEPAGPLPGEDACFHCPLPDCQENHPQCPRTARRQQWRENLRALVEDALQGDGTFSMILPNSRHQQSIAVAARSMVPRGTHVHSQLLTQGWHFVLQVQLERTAS